MKNEQKKEYVAPEMSIIEFDHRADLLQDSGGYKKSLGMIDGNEFDKA